MLLAEILEPGFVPSVLVQILILSVPSVLQDVINFQLIMFIPVVVAIPIKLNLKFSL